MTYLACVLGVLVVAAFVLRFSLFLPPMRGLPVLLYHKMATDHEDSLTIRQETFEQHLLYLRQKGYETVSLKRLFAHMDTGDALPEKPVLITFDDGYVNNLELAYPLLKKYGCSAVFFIPSAAIGKTSFWDTITEPIMTAGQLAGIDHDIVEFGLHSFDHKNYRRLTPNQIESDIRNAISAFKDLGIPCEPVFAYPYGGRPKDKATYKSMVESFGRAGIRLAFRIGNRVNRLPLKNVFEVKRISIRGTDSSWTFRTKLSKGRVKQV
jgi:peptidoglycan/xylan/chitin deacetylase (PgdA/CDA1 family)